MKIWDNSILKIVRDHSVGKVDFYITWTNYSLANGSKDWKIEKYRSSEIKEDGIYLLTNIVHSLGTLWPLFRSWKLNKVLISFKPSVDIFSELTWQELNLAAGGIGYAAQISIVFVNLVSDHDCPQKRWGVITSVGLVDVYEPLLEKLQQNFSPESKPS